MSKTKKRVIKAIVAIALLLAVFMVLANRESIVKNISSISRIENNSTSDYEAKIGNDEYGIIEDALIECQDNDTITLLKDVKRNKPIDVNCNVNIDLAGYSIINENTNDIAIKNTSGTLTIKNSSETQGTIKGEQLGIENYASAKLIIENGKIKGDRTAIDAVGEVTITGGEIEGKIKTGHILTITGGRVNSGIEATSSGAEITLGTTDNIRIDTPYINGGIVGNDCMLYFYGGKIEGNPPVENANIVTPNNLAIIYTNNNTVAQIGYTVTYNANGGEGAPSSEQAVYGTDVTIPTTMPTREGYTFKGWSDGDRIYVELDEYSFNKNTTLYAIWEIEPEAKIGNDEYGTLQEAIDACPKDGTETTVTLLKDVTLSEEITIPAEKVNIILNMNNHKISYTSTTEKEINAIYVCDVSTLTITGGGSIIANESASIENEATAIFNGGILKIDNVDVFGSQYGIYNWLNGELTIENGNITSDGYGIYNSEDTSTEVTITGGTISR